MAHYFGGLAFYKFWFVPMGIVPLGTLAFLIFIISALICTISTVRKKGNPKNIAIIGIFPIFVIILYYLPMPSFVDGMHKTLSNALSQKDLVEFAANVRIKNPNSANEEVSEKIISELMPFYPKQLSLSRLPPRIEVKDKYISVFYGSALTKHWGYVVGNVGEFPIEHIPESMYSKVYDGVWVYDDIW
ncbi:MAG TPA: hypothetical protein VLB90_06235 [Pseudomonadales bacterium]|nr:hypothetical protein [Pseudomonadales bacterium]